MRTWTEDPLGGGILTPCPHSHLSHLLLQRHLGVEVSLEDLLVGGDVGQGQDGWTVTGRTGTLKQEIWWNKRNKYSGKMNT